MLPSSMLHLLVEEHQRELECEAERYRLIKEAERLHPVPRHISPRVWLGQRLISWGTRMQAESYYLPIPGTGK